MAEISTYNGDKTDKYNWSQGLTEVTVQVPLPEGTKPRHLEVKIQPKQIMVKLRPTGEVLLEGELFEKVKVEDSLWSVEDSKSLILNLEKGREAIWKTVIVGD